MYAFNAYLNIGHIKVKNQIAGQHTKYLLHVLGLNFEYGIKN